MAYYYQYNQEKVSSYHAQGQYQNDQESQFLCNNYLVQLRDIGATAASNGSTNSDCLDQIMVRLSSVFEFDPSKPDYHLWNHDTVQPTVNNGNQDYDQGSVFRPNSPSSSKTNLGPIVPPAGGKQKESCQVVSDDFYCGGHLFKAIYSFFVGKIKAM